MRSASVPRRTCTLLLVLATVFLLGPAWSGPEAAEARPRACASPGSKTLRQTSQVRVYRKRGLVVGCHFRSNRRTVFIEPVDLESLTVEQLRVAGPYAGFNIFSRGREGTSSTVIVDNLFTGRTVRRESRGGGRMQGAGTEAVSVTDLVLRENGAVAWIYDITAFGGDPSGATRTSMRTFEIRESDKGSGRFASTLLDSGLSVDPRSLALRGATIVEERRGAPHRLPALRHRRLGRR
jgi:hypothetical protein